MRAHTARLYGELAEDYDKLFARPLEGLHRWTAGWIRGGRGTRILDVGVGTGLALPFYPGGASIVGIDLSQQMLMRARRRIRREELSNVELCRMDATALAFADDTFDAAVCSFVASVVDDPAKLAEEMSRVTRSGAQVVFFNHFCPEVPFLRVAVRKMSPFCAKLGWNTTLTIRGLVKETPLRIVRVASPLRVPIWRMVETINDK